MEMSQDFFAYNQVVHQERTKFIQRRGLQFFTAETDPKKIHAFMILWTAYSVKMTEQVEAWIKRAGESTVKKGLKEIGSHLNRHAEHEAGHDQMLVEDLKALVQLWNKNYQGSMSVEEVLGMPTPKATQAYIDLHEEVIQGQNPYCQVAIEYEIERLSIGFGPKMIENVMFSLGSESEKGLSFLEHHVVLDQGHTKFNMMLMEKTITSGGTVKALADIGVRALQVYGEFLDQCAEDTQRIFFGGQWN